MTVRTPEADLTGWTREQFTASGFTHDVYYQGSGPGVVLIPEMPGVHPGVLALGNHLVDNGFTVAIPGFGRMAHSVLTLEVREVDGQPAYEARKRVVEFLKERLV